MGESLKTQRLKKACQRARLDFNVLIQQCRDGEAQFFDNPHACAITSIGMSGAYKTLYVMVAGGTLNGLRALNDEIDKFARDMGCQAIQTNGRLGFQKPAEKDPQGYKPIAVVYEKVL